MLTMYDSVTVPAIPSGALYAAGYVDGMYQNISAIEGHCPDAHILTIAVTAAADAECLDVETGDAVASQVPEWVRRQKARGVRRPVVYTSAFNVPNVLNALHVNGISRTEIRLWTAHYHGEHICNPNCGYGEWFADGTQWTCTGLGRNLDISLLEDSFFLPPPPADPHHYLWVPNRALEIDKRHINERATMERYDRLRKHPFRNRAALKRVRFDLGLLAGRVLNVAHEHREANGKPSWSQFHRGWRYQQLIHRAHGARLV